jgi:hypothetical protein
LVGEERSMIMDFGDSGQLMSVILLFKLLLHTKAVIDTAAAEEN